MGTKIVSTGIYIPEDVLTNHDLERMVDTSDEWITTRTGIKERRIAKEVSVVDMALRASEEAIRRANVERVDVIIVATITPEKQFPSTACLLQERMGIERAYSFDISAACSGFIYALDVADSLIKSEKATTVLIVGAERLSQIVNWSDRSTCVLFGDGAGAVLVSASEDNSEILASRMYSDGSLWEILYADRCGYIKMKGRELFKVAVRNMEEACRTVLEEAGVSPGEVDVVIPHQANVRIIRALAERLNLPLDKFFINIHRYGNTSAASIPIALHEAVEQGKLKRGDLVLMTAMGGGLTWGATLLRF